MGFSLLSLNFFFICILSIFCSTKFNLGYGKCLNDQKKLLLEMKKDFIFQSSRSPKLVQWNQTEDCCSWNGVECDGAGHVISLLLDNEGISGGVENSSSFFSLSHLQKLNLANNEFYETWIPRRLHNFTHLTHLNLSNAGFRGQVPVELSLMGRLVSLDLSGGLGSLELENPNLEMLIRNLTRLRELILDGVNISSQGSEWCRVISSYLPDLRTLSLQFANLRSPPNPSLLQLHSLSVLQLDGNDMSSTVPHFLANFSSLTTLSLSFCSLQGPFPERIFQVPTLQSIDLSGNSLNGSIPQFVGSLRTIVLSYNSFSGSLPNSFSNLTMLSVIDLSGCQLTGPIPSTMANLTELTYVDFSRNEFTSSVPLFYMSKNLQYLDLKSNNLSGSLSSKQFEGHFNLVHIDLSYNSLNGSIPESIFGLPSLQILFLNSNKFSGQVFDLNSSDMKRLDLSVNRLKGPIPESFFNFEMLRSLDLSNNLFDGTVEWKKIRGLRFVNTLVLSYNNLSVDVSSTDSSFTSFPMLNKLGLASCSMHSYPALENIPELFDLDFSNNKLTGELPMLPKFADIVDFSNNKFEGFIPHDIGNWSPRLRFLSLANNSLSGVIPTSLCNASDLRILDLSFNNLSGGISPCIVKNMTALGVLNVGRNNINGDIPHEFSVDCNLQTLDLSNNNLGGNIPPSVANCKSLKVLLVENNNLHGSFPCMLPSSLRVLVLRSNRFYGRVNCNKSWPNLQIIDIASNNFSGYLYPSSLSSWGGMMQGNNISNQLLYYTSPHNPVTYDAILHPQPTFYYIHTSFRNVSYQDKVTLNAKGQELQYVKILRIHTSIDFSCNNFHGEIPHAIGRLNSLYILNLSHNSLTGTIPKSIGNLTQLGSMDLSVNQLTGEIPIELAGLTFLSVLNLSYNKLVGPIPNSYQFPTFPATSFEENAALCGLPLNKSCKNTEENGASPPQPNSVPSDKKMEVEWDYVSAALGFVVGLGGVVWLLLFCHSLRDNLSERVDGVLEKIFDRRRKRGRRAVRRN